MKIIRYTDRDFKKSVAKVCKQPASSPEISGVVKKIIEDVRKNGDKALRRLTYRYEGVRMKRFLETGKPKADASTRKALEASRKNVLGFARRELRQGWMMRNRQGAMTGERFNPLMRVGIYVPGGTAPLISTAIMTCALAAAAGVKEIVAVTPPDRSGKINTTLVCALRLAGATEIYKIGGAQAIATLAYGTKTIKCVDKIFGPGNAYVVEAKRQLFGIVSIDLIPGPSELMVISDKTANPAWVASDLLAQAEHGKGSRVTLLTDSEQILAETKKEIEKQSSSLKRKTYIDGVLADSCHLVLVRSLKDGIGIANACAPEHMSIVTKDAERLAKSIRTSGAIFIGPYSAVAVGDFLAGPSHTLPTGGSGKSFSGLMADMFQRRTSIIKLDRKSLKKSAPMVKKFSEIERLDAHGKSVGIRLSKDM